MSEHVSGKADCPAVALNLTGDGAVVRSGFFVNPDHAGCISFPVGDVRYVFYGIAATGLYEGQAIYGPEFEVQPVPSGMVEKIVGYMAPGLCLRFD